MIEAELENKIIDKFNSIFQEHGVTGIQVVGSFQILDLKSSEESNNAAYLVVKANPRSYQTPTIPTCTIECAVSLTVRADVDYNGQNYMTLCETLMSQFESWQKCLEEAHQDFQIDDVFDVTGFVLGSGNTGIDQSASIFQYTHAFTIYGVAR